MNNNEHYCDEDLKKLIEKIRLYAPNADFNKVKEAYNLSEKAHVDQVRKSGEPYFIHPKAVANILADMQLDIDTICGGLLHDVVEDTKYEDKDIEEMFGKDVAILVDGVTKLGKIKYMTKEESQSENLRKMFLAMAKDMRVILIKLADRLHNMRTLEYMDPEKAIYKAQETLDIYAGIAHRLGISKIKWELEDLSLRYLDPEGYYKLVKKVKMKREQREKYIQNIVELLRDTFNDMEINCEVYGRPKHFYSIYKKMKSKNKSFDEIYDLIAIRVIVDSLKDCYGVLGTIHTLWKPMPGRFKDYIAVPKPNMYQSLHTTVIGSDGEPVEIQIRTHEMHNIAEYGVAAHWKYKEGITSTENSKIDEKLQWLRLMMEWEKDVTDPHEFLDALKDDVLNAQVYVFTPQGEVMELPNGSIPIDFAYRIHSKVGNLCTGAKVNGKMVPLDYKLQNGEIVEIQTSSNSPGPSRDWLNIVKTPNARNRIRQFFKKERREENIERGLAILEKELKRVNLNKSDVDVQNALKEVGKKFNQPDYDDFLATIGYGGIACNQVVTKVKDILLRDARKLEKVQQINLEEDVERHNITENEKLKSSKSKKKEKRHTGVQVDGLEGIYVRFAKCCSPLPGDDIVGYITRGRGVTVHRVDCENIIRDKEKYSGKMVKVSWIEDNDSRFEADIQIKANDRRGIVNEITHVISNEKIRLAGIYARKGSEIGITIDLTLEVNGIDQLNQVIRKMMNIPGVEETYRINGK
ncbi:RelA/SpoT family protein [Peptostreptococcus canis]|uniref:GTP diphosphokinase n=1 Tax=Peptostreptococcus canis TaxID=1159213 RepID=A0ABR6TKL0_9FIRM|nr:bifunctional (p)ppGpp synthetase/guanosine-3',5'-bis(diphosphate) 3'-pyrophosphohydrolase [Peptostreptococcus canis]MBC2575946.1 bifunctional (p)ppGpp synthetase/guanosine-3',5'-bis(diphosphate) 3'-pyrophosphohydrolase [Peptostreptococcus canis]MBP1997932.1 GTP pyrophosphokinase [Peptostreptococcus canis]